MSIVVKRENVVDDKPANDSSRRSFAASLFFWKRKGGLSQINFREYSGEPDLI